MDIRAEFSDPERVSARLEFHRRVIAEEEAAKAICDRVLAGPSRWWSNALDKSGTRTAGMVEILIQRSEALLQRSPLESLTIAEIAVAIAGAIEYREYPYDHVFKIRGQALRRQAFVLSYLGRLHDAANVAEQAEHYLQQIPVPSVELARLDLVRSNIARNMEKPDEAIRFARRAAENFLWFGEQERWLHALEYQACALYTSHDYRAAREVWLSMEKHIYLLSEECRAGRLHNLATCSAEIGDFDDAARFHALAAEQFERLGLTVNRVKSRYCLGGVLHAAGRYDEAIVALRQAWEDLETLGMKGDAALAALLLTETLLVTGQTEEVPAIARMLIDRCTRAGMTASAMTALAFLRETLATGHATPLHVRHVREFVRDTNGGRERPFVPLPQPLER
jgi:tetratricopeptide (TPR) repeat protein